MGTKRYTVTEKWKDPFFENLSNDYKLVWLFLNDDCDNAGILRLTMKRLNYSCDTCITEKDLLETFKGKVVKLPEGLFFLIDFNTTQYGTEWIDSNNKAVVSAKKKLIEIGLIIDDELRLPIDYKDSIDRPSIDYESTIDSTKDKDEVEYKAEAKAKEEYEYMNEVKDIDDTKVKDMGDKWIETLNQ